MTDEYFPADRVHVITVTGFGTSAVCALINGHNSATNFVDNTEEGWVSDGAAAVTKDGTTGALGEVYEGVGIRPAQVIIGFEFTTPFTAYIST